MLHKRKMHLHPLSLIIPLYFFLYHPIFLVTGNSPGIYPVDDIAVNCGSSGNSTAVDGRQWVGDTRSKLVISQGLNSKLIGSTATEQFLSPDPVPYKTARISRGQFTYTFKVSPGQKFIRLHFYPTSYRGGFKRSKAFFTVKAGPYTLLSNFSASLAADALGLQVIAKEFCVIVEENQPLIITFSPSPGGKKDDGYAFVNGIEIISIPVGLYHTREGDPGANVVGKTYQFPIDKSIALEMVQRLNVGGNSILPTEDTGMFREWSDSNFLLESSVLPVSTTIQIKYTHVPAYTAPQKVYQTSWSMVPEKQARENFNFTWKLPVDLGFRYLLRFHFCELEYEITENGHKEFSIYVNEQMAEANVDLIKWGGRNGVALYRDYVMMMNGDRMEGKRDLLIALITRMSHNNEWTKQTDTILKGLEVFKLSNTDNNLAGVNPASLVHASTSHNPKPRKSVFSWGGNAIATGVVILLTVLNMIVYQLRIVSENFWGNNISSSPSEGSCRRFSLDEVLLATGNFADELVIGRGGFGKVYKALIDGGKTIVAMKRLNSKSNQGENEFRTEIEMLSKLRHTHLVSLLGYCDESPEMILVYEFMEHGTLADHLYKMNSNSDGNISPLSWEQRLSICIHAARGLDYLHTGTSPGVIHRDVKTTNILLDKNWIAKISDFGLCKVGTTSHSCSHVSTDVKGTFGYLDLEYYLTHRLTKKSDVYSFGVVMMEVLCGRPAVDLTLEEEQHSLAEWARRCIEEKKLDDIIDFSLRDQISPQCLKVFAEVASKCLQRRPNERPTMADVVADLRCAFTSQEQCKNSPEELIDDALTHSIVPSLSILVQSNKNISQGKKRSKGWLTIFQIIGLSGKGTKTQVRKRKDFDFNIGLLKRKSDTHMYRRFSNAEIEVATNNFLYNLNDGEHGFSSMYKGRIDHPTLEVAIRCMAKLTSDATWAHIRAQSQLHHHHILSSIGYCDDAGHRMLVYNYMVNNSLHDQLYGIGHDPLSWKKRLETCIGAARGLQYLHSSHIIHRNVKPTKILLDENWVAKVSVFESFMMVPTCITALIYATRWYLDPEYMYTFRFTEKSDVYSFGMVLLEVLCRRQPYDPSQVEEQRFLVRWFRSSVQRKAIDQIIDRYLVGSIAPECLREFVKITWSCLLDRGRERPSMNDVVRSLQVALQLQRTWHNNEDPVDIGSR
ncbi:Receptor-like protein kinase [Actinidia chinensis var. chinensis]|uniref:Receptor-like protein kinase n=1 Tax=Actinidia chinensis var. chinensis TaxID=1590841 RepID=A0A2R6P9T5_ACTCC|nr:Receptor-like protein kinase [Actinidia chinensis var. chinensis]